MLKKAGIVVAAAAVGLLAVSPLAFAGESHKDWGGHGTTSVSSSEQSTEGIVNVTDTNVNTPLQLCNNDIPAAGGLNLQAITSAATGALNLLGTESPKSEITSDASRACSQEATTGDAAQS